MNLNELLITRFGLKSFRPHQAEVCEAVASGRDALLVMPTGAGKSLCFQVPGIARGGTTLVISPLIALIDDQVSRLRKQGFKAEGLHGGMGREALREISFRYLKGDLDFLFVAPERFAVPRFPEMLLKRKPALIAVDEAHCISHWGHDFRPDYRLIGERIRDFRPLPVIAMTATATAEVQDDIVRQLGLEGELRSIHGFWRSNIAIEVIESSPDERIDLIARVLSDEAQRPAIVYAPTRKKAEEIAAGLKGDFRVAHYHAGLEPSERERVQKEFLSGKLEAIVATVAFGMGIDKADIRAVIHAALPASVEGYYQEIGRAGRDRKPSRALLLYSRADEQTVRYLYGLNYPEPSVLERVMAKVPGREEQAVSPDVLLEKCRMDQSELNAAVQRLLSLGAVRQDATRNLLKSQAGANWKKPYEALRSHASAKIEGMIRFTESKGCRMASLVKYFGDIEESAKKCGHCDACAPGATTFRQEADERQEKVVARALFALYQLEDTGSASLFKTAIPDSLVDRRAFDHVLGVMERQGWVTLNPDSFEKDGKTISFTKVRITHRGKEQARRVEPDIEIWVESKGGGRSNRR